MHSIRFRTETPYDHLQRALDTLRRMGFSLLKVSVRIEDGLGTIRLTYDAVSPLHPHTLFYRIDAMPGVTDLQAFYGPRRVRFTPHHNSRSGNEETYV